MGVRLQALIQIALKRLVKEGSKVEACQREEDGKPEKVQNGGGKSSSCRVSPLVLDVEQCEEGAGLPGPQKVVQPRESGGRWKGRLLPSWLAVGPAVGKFANGLFMASASGPVSGS